jgi:small-conductance mechanosensitive channel
MTVTVEDIGKHLGKTIEDSMGRPTGKLVGLTADIKDEVKAIQVAQSNGEVSQYPIEFVRLIDGHPVLLQTWRVEAEELRREHDIIRRRNQALDLLLKEGDIDQIEYNQQRNGFEDLSKEINQKRDTIVDSLKQVEQKLEQQIRDLQAALTNNKMLYTASEIDQDTYKAVTESIREGLEISRKERKDLDNTREYLQAIDSLEAPTQQPPSASVHKAPDVVVIKMREPVET